MVSVELFSLPSYCSACSVLLQISIARSSVCPDSLRSLARTLLLLVPFIIRSRSSSSSRAPYSHVLIRCLSLIRYASNFSLCSCVQELNIYRWYMIFCLGSKYFVSLSKLFVCLLVPVLPLAGFCIFADIPC